MDIIGALLTIQGWRKSQVLYGTRLTQWALRAHDIEGMPAFTRVLVSRKWLLGFGILLLGDSPLDRSELMHRLDSLHFA